MEKSNNPADRYTEILQHRISYHFGTNENAPTTLDEASVEHIEKFIRQGFNQGELFYYDSDKDIEYRGWWAIV
jgi:hypothetical protein